MKSFSVFIMNLVVMLMILAIGYHIGAVRLEGAVSEKDPRITSIVKGRRGGTYFIGSRIISTVPSNAFTGDLITFNERVIPPVSRGGEPFLMMETQVTRKLYRAMMKSAPGDRRDRHGVPTLTDVESNEDAVTGVSWEEGLRFAEALSRAMDLPYSVRFGEPSSEMTKGFRYPLVEEWKRAATCAKNSCGLKGMGGQVDEWTSEKQLISASKEKLIRRILHSNCNLRKQRSFNIPGRRSFDFCEFEFKFVDESDSGVGLRFVRALD